MFNLIDDEPLIDRVAQALWLVAQEWDTRETFAGLPEYGQDFWRDRARAAVGVVQDHLCCDNCGGAGDVFGHSADCYNDNCCLAGGIDDCNGLVEECVRCSGSGRRA